MPTVHGNELNAICLRCDNLDLDRPMDPAGYCSKFDRHVSLKTKPPLLELHYCRVCVDVGQKTYEERLAGIRPYLEAEP